MADGDGLISMTPTSIAHSGTSASINADGGVDFSAVTSLSLNGVFTSDYDNYLIVFGPHVGTSFLGVRFRLRTSGTDATGSNYTAQELIANGASVSAARGTTDYAAAASTSDDQRSGHTMHLYGPALAQPTAGRTVSALGEANAYIYDYAWTHSLSTAYDGFTIYPQSNDFTGTVHVFGYEE